MADRERFVDAVLAALAEQLDDAEPREVAVRDEYSNEIAAVRFADGRTLMVKRAASADEAPRFRTSRLASNRLRKETHVVAPRHLDLPLRLDDRPVEAYWRIPYPTLERLWPELDGGGRDEALRDWGRLLGRIHGVRPAGYGPLLEAAERGYDLAEFLALDLEDRLRWSVTGSWPEALDAVDRLNDRIPDIARRIGDRDPVLVHNDLWTGNVLCDAEDGLRCVGVLDLEDAFAGPREADLAKTQVLHGPLFGNELHGAWFDRVLDGYGRSTDPAALAFFRAYHLVNMGFHAAVVGYEDHARDVARALDEELDALAARLRDRTHGGL